MSLFLGKIHHVLYNKILWFEGIEEKIIENVKNNDISIDDLLNHINKHFGKPLGNKPLEEVIDTTNIHGWLQQRIENAELRHAALITELLTWNPKYNSELIKIFSNQGKAAANEYVNLTENIKAISAPEIYQALNEYILDGMPCDRVNEILKNNEEEFSWLITTCVHRAHWERVGGNVDYFYVYRETWISAFVNELNPEFKYEKTSDNVNRIVKCK